MFIVIAMAIVVVVVVVISEDLVIGCFQTLPDSSPSLSFLLCKIGGVR